MISALVFLLINGASYVLALARGPFWCLLAFANTYFNAPDESLNWWAAHLPYHRWSLVSTVVLVTSMLMHRSRLAQHPLGSLRWAVAFFALTEAISRTIAVTPWDAVEYSYTLLTFLISCYCIVKGIENVRQYRLFLLTIVVMSAQLALQAYLHGRRIHGRLEGIGPSDAAGSNEFGLLLAAVMPLTVPFLLSGRLFERVICVAALPFLANAFVLCNSRGALVSLVVALAVTVAVINDKRMRRLVLVASLVAIPVFIRLADEAFVSRTLSILGISQAGGDEDRLNELSSGRSEIWKYSLAMVKDYPLGAGPNGYRQLAHLYLPTDMLNFRDPRFPQGTRSAHNTYLQLLIEQGPFGLLLWLVMCGGTLLLLFQAFHKLNRQTGGDDFLKSSLAMMMISYLSILLGGLFNSRIYYEFFWWQTALSVVGASLACGSPPGADRAPA